MVKPVHVTEQSFDQEVVKAETPVLVAFWAGWGGRAAAGSTDGGPRGPPSHLTDSPGDRLRSTRAGRSFVRPCRAHPWGRRPSTPRLVPRSPSAPPGPARPRPP